MRWNGEKHNLGTNRETQLKWSLKKQGGNVGWVHSVVSPYEHSKDHIGSTQGWRIIKLRNYHPLS
jgi:hypothetical protein